ncbi:MAG: hypothetical protein Q4A19_07665 [Johnsonella sp.]|nr:hypothetical protein [Johnsonella sp.]
MKKRNLVYAAIITAMMGLSVACSQSPEKTAADASSMAESAMSDVASMAESAGVTPENAASMAESAMSDVASMAESAGVTPENAASMAESAMGEAANMAESAMKDMEKEAMLKGKISEIKDMQFVVTDDKGDSYLLTFEADKKPEGLAEAKEGDVVEVSYTGELSMTDAFSGMIKSVKVVK